MGAFELSAIAVSMTSNNPPWVANIRQLEQVYDCV